MGSKAIFAGGENNTGVLDTVDIYDFNTNSWSIAHLSLSRERLASAAVNDRWAIFAGGKDVNGATDVVDVYDSYTNAWYTSLDSNDGIESLAEPRYNFSGTGVGDKAFFAGGMTAIPSWTSMVDIYTITSSNPFQDIVDFINSSINDGTLYPVKEGKPGEGQLNALVGMIWTASDLIDADSLADACGQLSAALAKTDGLEPPDSAPDFVEGEAVPALACMIQDLIVSLGCE